MVETDAGEKTWKEKGSKMLGGTHAALHEDIWLNARLGTQKEQQASTSFETNKEMPSTQKVAHAGGMPDMNTMQSHEALHEDIWLNARLRVDTNTTISAESSKSHGFEESRAIGTHGFEEGSSGHQNEPI